MKIDLVSRYFKPLKYSENVIRYVPELPLSFLLLVVFDRQQLQNSPPPICNTLCLFAKKSLQNEF